jgi:hypothetical protein
MLTHALTHTPTHKHTVEATAREGESLSINAENHLHLATLNQSFWSDRSAIPSLRRRDREPPPSNFVRHGPYRVQGRSVFLPLVVNGVVMGPFEEEEEGTGVASDVVKVQGGDPATPGPLI